MPLVTAREEEDKEKTGIEVEATVEEEAEAEAEAKIVKESRLIQENLALTIRETKMKMPMKEESGKKLKEESGKRKKKNSICKTGRYLQKEWKQEQKPI